MLSKIAEVVCLINTAIQISESMADPEIVYDLIFSDRVSRAIAAGLEDVGLELRYCDPDTSYEDDVAAYIAAVRKIKRELLIVIGGVKCQSQSK